MKCPRCGGDMSSGVCESCGFPVSKVRLIRYFSNSEKEGIKNED